MSSGEVRRVSRQDIQLVQNLIERCLQLYMNQKEVMDTLLDQARIEPGFTELVWQKLEEENREFFKAYHVRLKVKHQIMIFNKLLEQQAELMSEICPAGVAPIPVSNGSSYLSSLNQPASCYVSEATVLQTSRPDNLNHQISRPLGTGINGHPHMQQNLHTANDSTDHAVKVNMSANIHPNQATQIGVIHGTNGAGMKLESGYPKSSSFTWNERDGSVIDTRSMIGDIGSTSFSGPESSSQALNDTLLETDMSSFGFLGQIPRNFSFSDLTSLSSDILGSYSRSPYLPADAFLDPPGGGCGGDIEQLDTISEEEAMAILDVRDIKYSNASCFI